MSIATPERVKALTDAMIEGKPAPNPDEPASVGASKHHPSIISSLAAESVSNNDNNGTKPARPL